MASDWSTSSTLIGKVKISRPRIAVHTRKRTGHKFQDGTGNAYHDAAMYAMWERQAGKARYENQQKVISRAHARTDTAINKVIYNRGENIDGITHVGRGERSRLSRQSARA